MSNYHITVNLPPSLEDQYEIIMEKAIVFIKNTTYPYVLGQELSKKGKQHFHVALQTPMRQDNLERALLGLFNIKKLEYPKVLKIKKHPYWYTVINYTTKDNDYQTNISDSLIQSLQMEGEAMRPPPPPNKATVDDIADLFVQYYTDRIEEGNHILILDKQTQLIHEFMASIRDKISYSLYSRINHDKLIEYAKLKFVSKKYL